MSSLLKRGILALAVVPGLAALAACGYSNSGNSYGMSPAQPNAAMGTMGMAEVTIVINGMNGNQSFSPNPGRLTAGQTVSWRNADTVSHTATGSGFDTGTIRPGAASSPIRFANAGSFDYHCAIHPSMVGSLAVGAAGASPY